MTEATLGKHIGYALDMPQKFSSHGKLVLSAREDGTMVRWIDEFTLHDSLVMRWVGLLVGPGVSRTIAGYPAPVGEGPSMVELDDSPERDAASRRVAERAAASGNL
ncbi:MAG TPA: hypothetical protein VE057_29015 [Archangium sp.]|nr:hypothetical protein [Archangium sp.]